MSAPDVATAPFSPDLAVEGAPLEDARPLCTSESLTLQAHTMGALLAGGVMRISGPLTPELVRRGLDWLQDEHPILRAHATRTGFELASTPPFIFPRYRFETAGTLPIPFRSVVDPDPDAGKRVLQEELRHPIPLGNQPRIRVVLVRQSETANAADLVMCIDHTITDAGSAMMAMRQLLEFCADPESAPPPRGRQQKLPPGLDDRLPARSRDGRPFEPTLRLPVARLPKTGIGTAVERRRFSRAETDRIRAEIKAHRTTLHGLVAAAILKAIHQRFGMPAMTCLSSVDLRRRCRPPVPADAFGCYVDLLRTTHDITQPLWKLSQEVAFKLVTALAHNHAGASMLARPSWEMVRREIVPMLMNRLRGDGLILTTAGETGLGRKFGPFVLEDMEGMVSQEVLGAGFFGVAMETGGQLEVSLCYAPHCLERADAVTIADSMAVLFRTL